MFNEIKNIISNSGKVKVKIYSLEYLIENINDEYIIYPIYYNNKKSIYKSLEELFNYYTIYNESLLSILERINIIE